MHQGIRRSGVRGFGSSGVPEATSSALSRSREPGLDFDSLARDLARGVSRRELLCRLGSGLAAGFLAELSGLFGFAPRPAAAAPAVPPCSSSSAAACLTDAQNVLGNAAAGCFPESADQGSVEFWVVVDQCLS